MIVFLVIIVTYQQQNLKYISKKGQIFKNMEEFKHIFIMISKLLMRGVGGGGVRGEGSLASCVPPVCTGLQMTMILVLQRHFKKRI